MLEVLVNTKHFTFNWYLICFFTHTFKVATRDIVKIIFRFYCIEYSCVFQYTSSSTQPPPANRAKKPKSAQAPKPSPPKCKDLYDCDATDTDELTFKEGDIIDTVKEGEAFCYTGGLQISVWVKILINMSLQVD